MGLYLIDLVRQRPKFSTLRRRAIAIGRVHDVNEQDSPCDNAYIAQVVFGARLELGDDMEQKQPATPELMRRMVEALEDDNEAKLLRDRALLLVGAAAACGAASWSGSSSRTFTGHRTASVCFGLGGANSALTRKRSCVLYGRYRAG